MFIYILVLLFILIILTVIHWTTKIRQRRKRRRAIEDNTPAIVVSSVDSVKSEQEHDHIIHHANGSGSSSSSTICDEQTPLISENKPSDTPIRRTLWSRLRAFLAYEPAPIRRFNIIWPSNGTSLTIAAFAGLNLFFFLFRNPIRLSNIFVVGDRAGLMFMANLPVLYTFSAKNQILKHMTGFSYEALNILHRRWGEAMIIFAICHGIGVYLLWYVRHHGDPVLDIWWFINREINGTYAFIGYMLIYPTSTKIFRQSAYELFLATHVFLQAAALFFLYRHCRVSQYYTLVALVIFVVDRFIFRFLLSTRKFKASLELLADNETVALTLAIPQGRSRTLFHRIFSRLSIHSGWKTSEHIFITIPSLQTTPGYQAHPFTIASPASKLIASTNTTSSPPELRLVIRAMGGFSRDLLEHAKTHNTTSVLVDGPYGSQHALELLQSSQTAILIAGGSGIAVTYPLAYALASEYIQNPDKRAGTKQKVHLCWIVHDRRHLSWLSLSDIEQLRAAGVNFVIPPPTAEAGRPNTAAMLTEWVEEATRCVGQDPGASRASTLVVSGPDSLNRGVRNIGAGLIEQGHGLTISVEKFGW